jgi:hypothetical protein
MDLKSVLVLSFRWKRVVSFTMRLISLQREEPLVPIPGEVEEAVWDHNLSERCGEEKFYLFLQGLKPSPPRAINQAEVIHVRKNFQTSCNNLAQWFSASWYLWHALNIHSFYVDLELEERTNTFNSAPSFCNNVIHFIENKIVLKQKNNEVLLKISVKKLYENSLVYELGIMRPPLLSDDIIVIPPLLTLCPCLRVKIKNY